MRVINLLPWREVVYRKRCRNFVLALSCLTTAALIWALISYQANRQNRIVFHSRVAHMQATLSHLQQDHFLIQQALGELADKSGQLQSRIVSWQQQQQWQQLITEWQLLAEGAHISDISWQGNELLLNGVSAAADPLRRLINGSPLWRLEGIELSAQTRFKFVVSRTMQTEEGI